MTSELALLREKIEKCKKCGLCEDTTNAVPGEGSETADILFIGEAPGGDEDMQGLPFVGRAGKLLTRMIEAMKLHRKDVYIGNILSAEGQNTYCPDCKSLLIERSGYTILQNRMSQGGCPDCSRKIYGVWQ